MQKVLKSPLKKKDFWQEFSEIMLPYKGKPITDLQRKLAFQRPDFYSC